MADFSDMRDYGQAVGTAAASAVVSGATSKLAQKRQQKYNKELMNISHGYEQENLALQDMYQRSLYKDSEKLKKEGLASAGYSTADPNGTGTTAPSLSTPSTSAVGSAGAFPIASPDFTSSISDMMSAKNVGSQTRLNEIEAKYRAKLLEGKIGLFKEQIEQIKQQLPEQVNLLKEQVRAKQSEWHLNEKSVERLDADIDRLGALTKSINIDNDYKADLNKRQIKKYDREIYNLLQDGKVKEVEARLASLGILVNSDWLTTIAAISASGTSGELTDNMMSMLQSLLGQIPDAAGKILPSVADSVVRSAKRIAKKVAHGVGLDR